jgi:hypothetical protein
LKLEKSEPRHTGSSPPKKGILVAATPTGSHELPWLCRFPADLSPVSSIDASDVIGRRLKKGGGQLDGL